MDNNIPPPAMDGAISNQFSAFPEAVPFTMEQLQEQRDRIVERQQLTEDAKELLLKKANGETHIDKDHMIGVVGGIELDLQRLSVELERNGKDITDLQIEIETEERRMKEAPALKSVDKD